MIIKDPNKSNLARINRAIGQGVPGTKLNPKSLPSLLTRDESMLERDFGMSVDELIQLLT